MSGGQSYFSGVHLVFQVFQETWCSNKQNPSANWNATLPCPLWPQSMQIHISFRSRLDADHSLDFLGTYFILQACISFLKHFGQEWRVSVLALFA